MDTTIVVESPVGPLTLAASARGVTRLDFGRDPGAATSSTNPHLVRAVVELTRYFAREPTTFTVALDVEGTPFQRAVWRAVAAIPWGTTQSYTEVARAVGGPNHVRAVGGANGKNPVPILVPCHRVIAADGSLGGYSGGLDVKRALLAVEGRAARGGELPRFGAAVVDERDHARGAARVS